MRPPPSPGPADRPPTRRYRWLVSGKRTRYIAVFAAVRVVAVTAAITTPLASAGSHLTPRPPRPPQAVRTLVGRYPLHAFRAAFAPVTPIRKPECGELLQWEHEWNNQVSSFRAPVERAVATLKTWRILFTDYRRPLKTFKSSFSAAIGLYFFRESFA